MELKKEFTHMVDRMGLEEAELALAEIVWNKAERAMQGLPMQEATLLKQPFTLEPKSNELTREDMQFLTNLITYCLRTGQHATECIKDEIQQVWLLCDPDDDKTKDNFTALNNLRTYQRKVRATMRKLEKIQHKLKKSR